MLKTNLPLMSETELDDWITSIIENTNVIDLRTLIGTIGRQVQQHDYETLLNIEFKFCDVCNTTYPAYSDKCQNKFEIKVNGVIKKCQTEQLREFKTTDNLAEIDKNHPKMTYEEFIKLCTKWCGIKPF